MKHYEITYIYNGEAHTVDVFPQKGWESQYHQAVLNRIESLVAAGAIVTNLIEKF